MKIPNETTPKFPPMKEIHCTGIISIENIPERMVQGTLGIQIAEDGRVWICVNGIALLRFKPKSDYDEK